MEHINPRILRAEADKFDRSLRFLTERDRQRREHIVKAAQALLARHGTHAVTFGALALALRMGAGTLRRHFIDLDELLGEILSRHLLAISTALGEIPFNDPDRARKKREAYFTFTRTAFGGLTEAHLLYTRDRHRLPEDIAVNLEQTREGLGELLAGPNGREALVLLDTPYIPLANIEAMLAALPQEAEAPAETPAETKAETPAEIAAQPPAPTPARKTPALPATLSANPIRLRPNRPRLTWLRPPLPSRAPPGED